MLSYALLIGASVVALAIGSYVYFMAMNKCIKQSLFNIDQSSHAKIDRNETLGQIGGFIELHSDVNRFINAFSDIFEAFITILFIWSLVTICGALLLIQVQLVKCILISY